LPVFASALAVLVTAGHPASAADAEKPPAPAQSAEGLAFFESKIRPVLVEQCYSCHSADAKAKKKLKARLYLDTREGTLAGGDSGPALVAGKPAESILLKALKGDEYSLMPPKGKLPAAVIADFEKWIAMGGPDPRTGGAKPTTPADSAKGRDHWAYKPPADAQPPEVKDAAWPAGDGAVDRFLLARLEAAGLRPAPDADPATLLRRLHFDLVGLPPTPAEIDEFTQSAIRNPQSAIEKEVDRLLASPRFGERWGRHWLDLARYADSLTLRGFLLKDAWRYRDYVIAAYNADMPYDRFLREQIAGDLLPAEGLADRRRQMTAVTFLLLGDTNLEEQDKKLLEMDVVDDQLDAIGKGILGQTVTCARCHDHKFDPIPTRDYYALAGILKNARSLEHANVSKQIEAALPIEPAREEALKRHEAAVAALQGRIKEAKAKLVTASRSGKTVASAEKPDKPDKTSKTEKPDKSAKPAQAAGILSLSDIPGVAADDSAAKKVGDWQASRFSGRFIGEGYVHDKNAGKGEKTLTFHPELPHPGRYEVLFAYSEGTSRADNVPVTILSAEGEKVVHVNQKLTPPLDGRYVSLGQFRFESKEQGYVVVSNEGTAGHVFLPLDKPAEKEKERTDQAKEQPAATTDESPSETLKKLEAELKELQEKGPRRETVLALREEKEAADLAIHIRGSVANLGPKAPRGFLSAATRGPVPEMPRKESGRRQLADWLASADNPLTARVHVNRVWMHLLGVGLVRTVDNFGTTGETPSHPELLDHLAVRFMADGWSTKKLIRRIVLSRAYRMASRTADAKAGFAADPENRLLWKANRKRLEAECLRDAMLAVGGRLAFEPVGGPGYPATLSSDYGYKGSDNRRSVYQPVFRNALPDVFNVFDFAETGMPVGRRNTATVAPQALFLMNHPLVIEQSRAAADRLLADKSADDRTRAALAYRLALGRPPTDAESAVVAKFLAASKDPKEAWAMVVQSLFASAEFRYVE
jgi:cytochrome c553